MNWHPWASCSKLTMALVNNSLKILNGNITNTLLFFVEKCENHTLACANYIMLLINMFIVVTIKPEFLSLLTWVKVKYS